MYCPRCNQKSCSHEEDFGKEMVDPDTQIKFIRRHCRICGDFMGDTPIYEDEKKT